MEAPTLRNRNFKSSGGMPRLFSSIVPTTVKFCVQSSEVCQRCDSFSEIKFSSSLSSFNNSRIVPKVFSEKTFWHRPDNSERKKKTKTTFQFGTLLLPICLPDEHCSKYTTCKNILRKRNIHICSSQGHMKGTE
ncbi:hypothetical protein TNCT_465921 [Trichonephila clavata]|uniref:Uncharacterized protein n=1 Tax=Trichonephila clavata TaxID=2740835 RepID=A0A8X6F2N6_TRICU|nr:hypothetical protein TNCT_465921 [Trichonephila clavata]